MMVLRRARPSDLAGIYHLAAESGFGITTLPKEKDFLNDRLNRACHSFEKLIDKPHDEYYLFVLEDSETHEITGISAVEAVTGYNAPFYTYKVSKRSRFSYDLNIRNDYEVLTLVNDHQYESEMCTLYLNPASRKNNHGMLLSRGRFLFMANFPERFCPIVMAEMRGISDENGFSPFFEHVGKHFFKMSFAEADRLSFSSNKQFISDLLFDTPIYVPLLHESARNVIGKPHPSTMAAMKILFKEGFEDRGYIDIFDAGPTLDIQFKNIRTIACSQILPVAAVSDAVSSHRFLLANTSRDFHAVIEGAIIHNDHCIISKKTAALLQVKCGDPVRLAPLKMETDIT